MTLNKPALLYCFISFVALSSCNINLTECEDLATHEIPPYKLVKKKCLGPAGPHWYPVSLYKDGKYISEQVWSEKDTCSAIYRAANDLYLQMNICEKKVTEIRPDKSSVNLTDVDSIQMYAVLQKQTKTLSQKKVIRFIEDWNKSIPRDYKQDSVDLVFFPTNEYELTAYTKSGKKKFLAFNYLISERTHWVYLITGKKSEGYFKKLWED